MISMVQQSGSSLWKYKESGKPQLHIGFISISHSHHQVAIAFSLTTEVGMDLEQESEKVQIVKSKYFQILNFHLEILILLSFTYTSIIL